MVLLITGAGGSFSSVITATGIGNAIVSLLGTDTTSVIPAMFLAYFIGMIFRVAQGSGTVAGMTSMGIMATIAPAIGCHPVWIALACLSGGNSIGHVNDSGFWVATNMSGLTVTGGLKTYTLGSFISSVCIFVLALIGALVIPPCKHTRPHNMKEELYMQNAMIIDPKDNVAVAIEPIAAGGYRYLSQRGKRLYL